MSEERLEALERQVARLMQEVEAISSRNRRVETDKGWETSFFRRASIALLTYIIAATFLFYIGNPLYLLNALIPTAGYLLSTLTLPVLKSWWGRQR